VLYGKPSHRDPPSPNEASLESYLTKASKEAPDWKEGPPECKFCHGDSCGSCNI